MIFVAVDIGGTNIRGGVVLPNAGKAADLTKASVWKSEKWRHADEEKLNREQAVGELVGMLKDLIKRARLPMPMFNARLTRADGSFLAVAAAWWADAGVAVEIESREWHLRPADWERTMKRHAEMISQGSQPCQAGTSALAPGATTARAWASSRAGRQTRRKSSVAARDSIDAKTSVRV